MFGGPFFKSFEEDPFFSTHKDRIGGIDEMFSSMRVDPLLSISDGTGHDRGGTRAPRRGDSDYDLAERDFTKGKSRDMDVANPFASIGSMMSNMMGNMNKMMGQNIDDQNGHVYTHSSVMSYSNADGKGEPKIYQATTATRQAPGGIREVRKAVRDSEAGLEKMAVGRHIKERGHVLTRQRNTRSGDINENKDYLNIAEEDEPRFNEEWKEKASQFAIPMKGHPVGGSDSHHRGIDGPSNGGYRKDRAITGSSPDQHTSRKSKRS